MQTEKGRMGQLMAIRAHHVSADRLKQIGAMGIPVLVMTGTEDAVSITIGELVLSNPGIS